MGLAAPKNRARIGNDPQNTIWANNTTRFGHRILAAQGWTPGSTLGAKDASHSTHYTVASNSHIRVLLKDDNLGLGAKRGSERAENFGLAGLESVLGRLNGREEEVKKEEARREDVERRGWVAKRYGFMNFVSGGFLVGDKIEKGVKVKREMVVEEVKEEIMEGVVVEEKKPKKRKRMREDLETVDVKDEVEENQPKLKRKTKSMNLREAAAADEDAEKAEAKSKSKKEKKDKKSKKVLASEPQPTELSSIIESPAPGSEEPLSDKAKRKAERRARKEEKKLKRAPKKAAKEAARTNSTSKEPAPESSSEENSAETPTTSSVPTTGTSTPAGRTFGPGARHAVRARYIRQKNMASMDPQALKEIFMIKTPA